MKNILIAVAFLSSPALVYGESCQPNFEVEREHCENSDQVIGTSAVEEKSIKEEKREPRTGKALADAYCTQASAYASKWKVSPEDVKVRAENEDTRKPWFEVNGIKTTGGSFRRIVCIYSAQAPTFEKVAGSSCAIIGATDASNCFAADRVNVDTSVITNCMYLQPKDVTEIWQKTECLVQAYTAAKQSRLVLPGSTFDQLEGAMKAFSRGAPSVHVREYLKKELETTK